MAKVYVIVRDDKSLLVGIGGRSGKKKFVRRGYHLPGGTIDEGESVLAAALRELLEEMGVTGDDVAVTAEVRVAAIATEDVSVVVVRTSSVDSLVAKFKRPPIVNEHDEPFDAVAAIPLVNCWEN